LLGAFDRSLVAPEPRWRAPRWLALPIAVTALAAGLLVFWKIRPAPQPAQVFHASVQGDAAAVWSQGTGPDHRERVILQRGTLSIKVDHRSFAGRLQVALPDGELEDIGTIFTVSVEDGRTIRVAVLEGSVLLRIRGQPPVAIGPGDVWIPHDRTAAATAPSSAPAAEPGLGQGLAAAPRAVPPPPPRLSRHAEPAPPDSAADFRAATAALRAGDNRGAAAAFTAFLVRHPADARAEDAAYLRVIALQRAGAERELRRAAQEYLRLYPLGFRRADVESLNSPGRTTP
jgi:hypothetical protein